MTALEDLAEKIRTARAMGELGMIVLTPAEAQAIVDEVARDYYRVARVVPISAPPHEGDDEHA